MKIFLSVSALLLASDLFAQDNVFKVKRNNSDTSKITLVGTWVNKSNKTSDGKEYTGVYCKDTIEFLSNGKYLWKQCDRGETGSWKLSSDRKELTLYERQNPYLEAYFKTSDLGEMWMSITELDKEHFVSLMATEDVGQVRRYYYPLK